MGKVTDDTLYPILTTNEENDQYFVIRAGSVHKIKKSTLKPADTISSLFPKPTYKGLADKIPLFRSLMLDKTKDVCVVITGESLVLGGYYGSDMSNITERPPLLGTTDFCSAIFDKLANHWSNQSYRRYDHAFFTLIGAGWGVFNDKAEWYDVFPYHVGNTKLTTAANAGCSFIVPIDAWQFNFIYRTDSLGAACTVAIAEGNSKMEAWNGSAWVEANGFVFTMLEPAITATKGNTIFQKRLKMRCKNKGVGGINSIGETKSVTITKGNNADRFNLVGVEWSKREFMLTVIAASGGGKAWVTTSLPTKQDSDIWVHNPDLIIAELTTYNYGASLESGLLTDPTYYSDLVKRWYFNGFSDEPTSLMAKTNGCEYIFMNGTIGKVGTDGAFDVSGNLKFGTVTAEGSYKGSVKSPYENFEAVDKYMYSDQSTYAYFPIWSDFKKISEQFFGLHGLGMIASDRTGATLSHDGIHWNNNGNKLASDIVTPIFDF